VASAQYRYLYFHIFSPVIFLFMAAFFIGIAFRAWRYRRPFLLSQRWQFGLVCGAFTPMIVNSFSFTASGSIPLSLRVTQWLSPAMFVVMLVYFFFQMRGYTAFAVTEKSFREAFLAAVAKLGFTCEEQMSSMRILPQDVRINVAIFGWSGTGILRSKRDGQELLQSLAREINAHFETHGGETNQTTTLFYAVIGLFMIAFSVSMFLLRFGR